jgi:hypothetical protein
MIPNINAAAACQAARLSAYGSPEYHLACQICLLRGEDPEALAPMFGTNAPAIMNWQRVIALQALESVLRIAMRNGPTLPTISPQLATGG